MKNRRFQLFEALENRVYLTVAAELGDDGDLLVGGDADGAVEVLALDAETYQVSDNGVVVDTIEGVTDDIRITLEDQSPGADDQVTVDLAGQSVDRLFADLGDGNNSLTFRGGTATGSLRYEGGDGNDTVNIAKDTIVERSVVARLQGGDNNLNVDGQIGRNLFAVARDGNDALNVGEAASIGGRVLARLGHGDNTVSVGGEVTRGVSLCGGDGVDTFDMAESASAGGVRLRLGSGDNVVNIGGVIDHGLSIHAADGGDLVTILATANIGRRIAAHLGDGDNALTLEGAVDGDLAYRGGDGNDKVTIAEGAVIERNARLSLGGGENTVSHAGEIGGNLIVRSANGEDVVDITDDAIVGGTIDSQPGVEPEGRPHRGGRIGGRGFRHGGRR